jgi:hypothetical protein
MKNMKISNDTTFSQFTCSRINPLCVSFALFFAILLIYLLVIQTYVEITNPQNAIAQRLNKTLLSDRSLPSLPRNSGILTGNLTSIGQGISDVIGDRIDTRLQDIKARLDEFMGVVLPAILAAGAAVAVVGILIISFIISYWFNRFRQGRRHKSMLTNLLEHILQQSKENMEILKTVSSPTNDVNVLLPQLELSNNALKATISSGLFLDLSPDVQYAMLRLEKDIDRYNRVVLRKVELRESAILNNMDEQLANKVVGPYDDSIADYVRDILSLSESLIHLMEHSRTGRGTFKVKSKNAKQI